MTVEFPVRQPRDVVEVRGPDAVSFLQGQLSQDVAALEPGSGAWSLLLQPNGKMVAWLRVVRVGADAVQLDVDTGFAELVVDRLSRFLLRTKAEIAVVARASALGPADERARIEAAVPAMGAEITAETIPAELGQWLIDASVSFTKGCYTGQELVARIDSRGGHVPRHLRVVEPTGAVSAGDSLEFLGRDVGVVTSVVDDDLGRLALAFVHRSVDTQATVEIGGQRALVR